MLLYLSTSVFIAALIDGCASSYTFNNNKGEKIAEMDYTGLCIKNDSIYGESKQRPVYKDSVYSIVVNKSPNSVIMCATGFLSAFTLVAATRPKCAENDGSWDLFNEKKICEAKDFGYATIVASLTGVVFLLATLPKDFEMKQIPMCESESEKKARIEKERIESFERFNKQYIDK